MKIDINWQQQFDVINSTPNFYAEEAYIENKQILIFDSYERLVFIIKTETFTAELVMAEEIEDANFHKQPIEPGTKAECLATLSQATQASRLDGDAEYLHWRLFADLFPEHEMAEEGHFRESYPGASDDIWSTLQRRLAAHRVDAKQDASEPEQATLL